MTSFVIRTVFFSILRGSPAHRAGQKDESPTQALEAGVNFFKRIAPSGTNTSSQRAHRNALMHGGQILNASHNWPMMPEYEWSDRSGFPMSSAASFPQAFVQFDAAPPHYTKSKEANVHGKKPGDSDDGIQLHQLVLLMLSVATCICCCGCCGAYWWKSRQSALRKESLKLPPMNIAQLLKQAETASEESDMTPRPKAKAKAPVLSDDDDITDDDMSVLDMKFESKSEQEKSAKSPIDVSVSASGVSKKIGKSAPDISRKSMKSIPDIVVSPPADQPAPSKPTTLSGHLLMVSTLDPATWTPSSRYNRARFVHVREECLRWWDSKEQFQDAERKGGKECSGFVDFKMNPCEVEIDSGCAAVVVLRPVGGFWVMSNEVLGADLGRPLCFDTSVSEHDSFAWMTCLQENIKNGQSAAASRAVPLWQRNLHASYSLHQQIGEGTRGVVYSCTPKGGLDQMAVKIVDMVETPMDAIQKELEILQGLRHQNIMQTHAAYVERCFVCIVSHKFEASLLECMQKHWAERGPIPCTEVVPLQQQILSAINYVHSQKLVLRDLRCEKCLVNRALITDPNCHVVLSGFGNAMLLADGQRIRQACGCPSYWAPELYALDYAFKVDVWAAGVVIFGMIHGFFAFKNKDAVRTQLPYISTDLPEPCQDFLKQMLEKSEQLRPTAKQLLQHPWMSSSQEALNEWTAEPPALPELSSQMSRAHAKSFSPARFVYTKWRRSILIERLQKEHRRRASMSMSSGSATPNTPSKFFGSPALLSWRITKSVLTPGGDMYDWCQAGKVEAQLQAASAASAITAKDMMGAGSLSRALPHTYTIRRMLEEHKIDLENLSKEPPYRFEDLVKAVQSGSLRLMLDASHFKSLVIVVDIVYLRIQPPKYLQLQEAGISENREYLVEFSSSRTSDGKLPSSCKRAHENTKTTVKRIIDEKLGMSDCAISWEISGEAAEERYASELYPGIATVYRTEIIDAVMTATDPSILGRCGLPERVDWRLPDHLVAQGAPRSVFRWVPEDACLLQQVKLGTHGSLFTSSLVHAELGGLTDDTLKKQLRAFGVDVSKFGRTGTKSLRDLLAELNSGECVLMQGANSAVLRMVEIVALWLVDKGSGKVMARTRIEQESGMQSTGTTDDEAGSKLKKRSKLMKLFKKKKTQQSEGEESGDDEPKGLPCLPRRPDESLFHTAKRIITEVLGMDEDDIDVNPSDIRLGDSEAESEQYPGLRLVYRKHTVIAAYRNSTALSGNVKEPAVTADVTQKLEETTGQVEEAPAQDEVVAAADVAPAAADVAPAAVEAESPAQVAEEKGSMQPVIERDAEDVDASPSQAAEEAEETHQGSLLAEQTRPSKIAKQLIGKAYQAGAAEASHGSPDQEAEEKQRDLQATAEPPTLADAAAVQDALDKEA